MPTEGPKLELYNVHRIGRVCFAKVGALNREAKQAKSKRVVSFCKVHLIEVMKSIVSLNGLVFH